ncbi:MAG: hypothetical protein R3321_15615 [Nitrososphaeraceae archaeon]|nr:hypothetical protein [Nitrososphaeraceae archaeon]
MIVTVLIEFGEKSTILLLLVALGLFGSIALMKRNYKSFQTSISIFIIFWLIGEIFKYFSVSDNHLYYTIGAVIHLLAMIGFALMIWFRFYKAKKTGKTISETLDSLLR